MTTADFMKISSVNSKFAMQTEASKKLQDEELKVAETFAGLMNQTAFLSNDVVDEVSSNMDMKVNGTQSAADSYERYSYKDNQIDSAETPGMDEKLEEASADLETAEQEVFDTITEEYGVSEEEVQNILDDLGLSVLDLLNPKNLVNFIMQLTGVTSSEELLLDGSFLKVMETMDALAEGLMKGLDVDAEGLQALVNQMELVEEETLVDETTMQVSNDVLGTVETQVDTLDTGISEEDVMVDDAEALENAVAAESSESIGETETLEDGINIQVEKKDETSESKTENVQIEEVSVEKVADKSETFAGNQESEGNALLNQGSNAENVVLNQSSVTTNAVADVAQTQFSSYLSTDTVQIMEQIVNQMKVTLSQDVTSMEMQLNPENLGKVYVNISSEEGVVNAQFHATNEVVKEALEAQIATLRENLNQAGVKVDAIEVTIASHEFERNLEQNHHNPEDTKEAQNEQTTKRRNISVDSLDDLKGVMSEEEALVAQIMKDNGNSVDFTA